ncbi:MAG: molecular chaperone HtpG [Thiotrichales bacterium]
MTTATNKENLSFEAEVNQLLQLMIHSLYSNKEIFLRELISNAADACDKLRFEALSNDGLMEGDSELEIEVDYDKDARTITIRDNGIGMSREEVINNIGTIAKSGTAEFLKNLTGDQAKDSHMIGQFGVGFYSSFIVASKVEINTRRASLPATEAVHWESTGESGYELETIEKAKRGTEIILHLREGEDEFLDDWRLRSIITKYSDHVPLPVKMPKRDDKGEKTEEWETVNKANALWTIPKKDITDEEYKEFYKHVGHDFEDPLAWVHSRVEGKLEYTSLLYIPGRAPFDLFEPKQTHGVKLYVQRVFIMDDAEHLMPRYLRFVRGVIDSNDLPLNVSREILQSNKIIDSMRSGSVKKVLGLLESIAKNDPEKYAKFWTEFGKVMKEGPVEDFANREQILKLLRFASTHNDSDAQNVSLEDYVSRMKEGQEKIYYITADNYTAALHSPHLEIFKKKGIEVLLLSDRVDEWMMGHVTEFDGKPLQSVAKGDLDLAKIKGDENEDKAAEKEEKENKKAAEKILKQIKESLGDKVEDVRISERLTESPSCIVLSEHDMALYMQQLMKQAGQEMPSSKPTLEVNPSHPIIKRLEEETDDDRFTEWSELLLDQAVLSEGGQLEDPASFVRRMNDIMLTLSK